VSAVSAEQADAANREDAESAGLRWVSDERPGIRRRRRGKGFLYARADGSPVPEGPELARIRRLAVPPAWSDVWICPDPRGHLQATGRDARGRKQYRYHDRWREARDANKFDRIVAFGRALPRIRRRCSRDLGRAGLPRERVLAAIVRLLDESLIRVGNREYARDNKSFGLTTLRSRHVKVRGAEIRFSFRGKSGVEHSLGVSDKRVARVVRRLQDLPGQDVFQYLDEEGRRRGIDSSDVNDYLREISGSDFTAKDFRTWTATVLAAEALREMQHFDGDVEAKKNVVAAIESVAARLGNTPAVCRRCYVHPAITDSYLDGTLLSTIQQRADEEIARIDRLGAAEAAVLVLLRHRLGRRRRRRDVPAA
jgi:DNA topoisomerase-1